MSHQSVNVRSVAGLNLKNSLVSKWDLLNPEIIQNLKLMIMQALGDPDPMIKKVAGSIITAVVHGKLDRWPGLIPALSQMLKNPSQMMGALGALEKICEDSAADLDPQTSQLLVHTVIELVNSQDPLARSSCLKCINEFLSVKSDAIWGNLDQYLGLLYTLTSDSSLIVQRYVCQAFNHIVELDPHSFGQNLGNVIDFMLLQTCSQESELAIEAGDFWIIAAEHEDLHLELQQYLPKIVPVLLKNMVYSENDLLMLEGQAEENFQIADSEQDIKPRFHKSKAHEQERDSKLPQNDESDYDSEDEDDYDEEWNIRKCCAAALDMLASVYNNDILDSFIPVVNQMLNHPEWQTKEAGILALGAVAQGASNGMEPHLPMIVPLLIQYLRHEKPLVRSITCWTVARYYSWIANFPCSTKEAMDSHHRRYMLPILEQILHLCLDGNKEVQKAACSSLAALEEEARDLLIPFLDHILDTMTRCFGLYQRKNLLILYDAFGTLAEFVGDALNTPQNISKFMPPLLLKWQSLADDDYDLFPLLECLSSVATSLCTGFQPFALSVWERAMNQITKQMLAIEVIFFK